MTQEYDIIGDIHGRADLLEDLLKKKLGYKKHGKGYAHPEGRKVIFLGDFIDKGNQHKRVLQIVRTMVDSGKAQAIMGNHEFNAICYATPNKKGKGYVRKHTPGNEKAHKDFLKEYPFCSKKYKAAIAWFKTLPVSIDLPEFRAVHACWDDDCLDVLRPHMRKGNTLKNQAYHLYGTGEGAVYGALGTVLKAPEVQLSVGMSYEDAQGTKRNALRVLWWRSSHCLKAEQLDIRDCHIDSVQKASLTLNLSLKADFMRVSKPTFIGHFALPSGKFEHTKDVAVLDYKGQVSGYRWKSGDSKISKKNFVFSA